MENLSLHILDIAENSIRAGAKNVRINIVEDEDRNLVTVSIRDDGKGMDRVTVEKALDPFFTTKHGKKVGLGLALLAQASREAEGKLSVEAAEGGGTRIIATFKQSHPDMKPMGNMAETLATLVAGYPGVRFVYDHRSGTEAYYFDSHKTGSERQ